MDFNQIARELIPLLGGKENIASAAHCATRLRLVLVDDALADQQAIGKVDGVKGCFRNAGQMQVIFGTGVVNKVYAAFIQAAGISESSKSEAADLAARGEFGVMVAARGDGAEAVPLEEVAGSIKLVPPDHDWVTAARKVGTSLGD